MSAQSQKLMMMNGRSRMVLMSLSYTSLTMDNATRKNLVPCTFSSAERALRISICTRARVHSQRLLLMVWTP